MIADREELYNLLESRVRKFNTRDFIEEDPISIPHRFKSQQDIEITAFWTAMFSWGQRKTIISKASELFSMMDNAPADFILNHTESELKRFLAFSHRTFQPTDTLYFIRFFRRHYQSDNTLESAFRPEVSDSRFAMKTALEGFHNYFFDDPLAPSRTKKHVATPATGSGCKRLNMFLRWMVRQDESGVDFGIWKAISPAMLMLPVDVHVHRIALKLGLLTRKQADWKAVEELTQCLREFDPEDPCKYDFALFGMGVLEDTPGHHI